MQSVTHARNEIGPLLDELINQLGEDGCITHRAHFNRIRGRLYGAEYDWQLAQPMIELTTCIAMGFRFSTTANALLTRILDKTAHVVKQLEGTHPTIH